jgi:tryptophanyl-tRNA synthetase
MIRRLSGFQPTGHLHLGNYLGAILPTVAGQRDTEFPGRLDLRSAQNPGTEIPGRLDLRSAQNPEAETIVLVVDLHALTVTHEPARVRALTVEVATILMAAGVDTLYAQSHLPAHTELHYLLECATGYGEARRMIQFREKSGPHSRLSLLTYPVLMAADVLLHDVDEVPVGADQSQHVELARNVANRFNRRYGPTFTVPRAVNPPVAARIMDLADPTRKMGKSNASGAGVIGVLDPPETIRRKITRAVSSDAGVANLREILTACGGACESDSYAVLKAAVVEAVVGTLSPIQRRYGDLAADPGYVMASLADGAARVADRAAATVARAREAIGLLSPGEVSVPRNMLRAGAAGR